MPERDIRRRKRGSAVETNNRMSVLLPFGRPVPDNADDPTMQRIFDMLAEHEEFQRRRREQQQDD